MKIKYFKIYHIVCKTVVSLLNVKVTGNIKSMGQKYIGNILMDVSSLD